MVKWTIPNRTTLQSSKTSSSTATATGTGTATSALPAAKRRTATATSKTLKTTTTTTPAMTTKRKTMSTRSFLAIVIVIASLVRVINGFLPIQLNAASGRAINGGTDARKLFGGYRITPKHCRATKTLPVSDPRVNGPTICMFNHECAQRNGEVVGACMDGFLFGACCQIPNLQQVESTLINDAQNAYFHQYQQQKLQLQMQQQTNSNPIAAQSYENYGVNAQQSTGTTSNNIDRQTSTSTSTKHYLTTTSNYRPDASVNSTPGTSNTTRKRFQGNSSTNSSLKSSTQSKKTTESSLKAQINRKTTNSGPMTISATTSAIPPPLVNVPKDSVKISSPSSSPQNDDFVLQVLSTLSPEHEKDFIMFATEVPMKIAENSGDRLSSESNSFEEEQTPLVTQTPVRLIEKPTSNKETTKTQQQQQLSTTHKTIHQQDDGQHQTPQKHHHQQQQTNHKHKPSTHNHNNLVVDVNEFTHSDITHPGADADLVENLQFSTGYGTQPTIIDPPKRNDLLSSYETNSNINSNSNIKSPHPDDKYVLVQTISNDQPLKQSITPGVPTTESSITTHVDSIESIILQLNNTNAGPIYSVIDQNDQSYGSSTILSPYTGNTDNSNNIVTDKQDGYYGSSTSPATASAKPLQTSPTNKPTNYFDEIETKRPQHNQQVPAYLEPLTTNLNYLQDSENAADISDASSSYGLPAQKPEEHSSTSSSYDEPETALNEATMPNKNYNDVIDDGHRTSEFNKMPVVGIAYPVDMSYMEEDGNLNSEDSGYQKLTIPTSTDKPILSSSTVNTYNSEPEQVSIPTETTYTKLSTLSDSTNQNYNRPFVSYINVATSPAYNQQQPQASNYDQIPEDVSVTSHTTKIQDELDSTAYETAQTQKLTTISYVDTTVTTSKPYKARPSTLSYSTSHVPTGSKPPYDSLFINSSTAKPKPSKRPSPGNIKKTTRPRGTKRPNTTTTTYTKIPQHDYLQENHQSTPNKKVSTNSYEIPVPNFNQDTIDTYGSQLSVQKQPSTDYNLLANKPSSSYNQESTEKRPSTTYKVPSQPSVSYDQPQLISSPPVKKSPTRKPSTNKKPVSNSYVSGPTTIRQPTTSAYDHEVPPLIIANDKLDSFAQSTAGSVIASPESLQNIYMAPVLASAVTPIQIQGAHNGNNKPGFVKIKATTKPSEPTVVITPKPTTNSYVKQPSADSYDSNYRPPTTQFPQSASTSYVYSATITRRPEQSESTSENVSPPISNDFYDPGYFGSQAATKPTYAVPSDDRPAFPGYYGPTPTYPAFQIPGEKNDGSIEETYTSPNDFVNFPPVRNPNLNMSATSSAVTSDLELSTPAFVEDGVLKDKMNTLVHKIVESLQGNFEALADIIDETAEPSSYQSDTGTTINATRKPTRKPVTTKTKPTTKKPVNRLTTKGPTKKTTITTRKPVSRRTTTKKPITTRRPTRKTTPTTTSVTPFQDEIIDEEDGDDINLSNNEIGDSDTLSVGVGGRKIQCGVRPHVKSGRIVGGKGSTFGAYPWQVLVRESTWLGLFTKNKCGGVLITNKYVITAAHCQPGFLASLVAVMGEFDISGDLENKKAVTKNVKRVIVHRQYDPATFENDLALLELESPVQFDTHIVPICMPQDTADFTGRMATVTGWGRLKYGGGVPSVLQEVQVPIIENSVCQEMFHTAGHNKKILNSFLCAGYANGQKDSCEGDSGGPLVLQRPDGRYELAGTVSHGIKCAAPYLPGVYMRTTFYKPWLRSITGVK